MAKDKRPSEYDLLDVFLDELETHGTKSGLAVLELDAATAGRTSAKAGARVTVDGLRPLADKCLARKWLEPAGGGSGGPLALTLAGFGVARARRRREELLARRPWLKATRDFIEAHREKCYAVSLLIALLAVLIRFLLAR